MGTRSATDRQYTRRQLLAGTATGVGALAIGSGTGSAQSTDQTVITASPIADGFTSPVDVVVPPDSQEEFLVVDQVGIVHRISNGDVAQDPFLDLTEAIVDVRGGYSEMGLLGLALHPNYADNRRVFVRYSAPRRAGTPTTYSHTYVLAEFQTDESGERIDPSTERTLLEIPQPQANHNAADIAFGPDGYLYAGVGDGGGANDSGAGHVSDWYAENPGGNGQDIRTNLLGSILRIDVDQRDGEQPYGIPPDNPLVGSSGLSEQYAWGLRNPWRLSFDGENLYAADPGQNRREEVNRIVSGGNYGWNVREGTTCFDAENPDSIPDTCPTTAPGRPTSPEPLRQPVIEYTHDQANAPSGVAVIGGYIYRGEALGRLNGQYVFSDWAARNRLFLADPTADPQWPISIARMQAPDDSLGSQVLAFGQDNDGELLVLTTDRTVVAGESGALHRLSDSTIVTRTATESTPTPTTTGNEGPGFGAVAAIGAIGALAAWGVSTLNPTN